MDKQRVIGITGASGFMGSALARILIEDGVSVRLFDRRANQSLDGLSIDVLHPSAEQFRGLDSLVHLIALTGSKHSNQAFVEINVALAARTLSAAIEAGVKRFVFLSSLGVHGKCGASPIRPDDAFAPTNTYSRSKCAAERALNHINQKRDIELIMLRAPMVYGAEGEESFLTLLRLIRTGLPLPFGTATAQRTFCSLANSVSATRAALGAHMPSPIFLPADPDNFSARELIESIKMEGGYTAPLFPVPRGIMKLVLSCLGRSDLASSLFETMTIDRSHWTDWNWTPVETGRQAVAKIVSIAST